MKIKRGLKKTFNTTLLAGALYLLPITGFSQSLGQSSENIENNKKNKNDYTTKIEGRAIVSPKNNFDHKSYAKVRFVNNELNKDTTFYANHMGIVNYSLPLEEEKDSTRYNVYIFPGDKKESDDFVPYKTIFSAGKGKNGLDLLENENSQKRKQKNKLEEIAKNEN